MIVTHISSISENTGRCNIFIDGNFAFSLVPQDIAYFKIKEGVEIPKQKYDYIIENIVYIKAQNTALKYVGYKMRSEKEVRDKLLEKEYSQEMIEKVITFLLKYGYINDKKYCIAFIKDSIALKPKGKYLIGLELSRKGVNKDIIEQVLSEIQFDESEMVKNLVQKKFKDFLDADDKKIKKIYDFLLRRGFKYDIIKDMLNELKNE